ncbi:membrane integrity-associated transporter subunit PqiC [Polynucleobacter sp. UK-Pondora-W15]|nr:membrane integrity-associated transporter subunit PqiC [Polynucleobacter alcilacus]
MRSLLTSLLLALILVGCSSPKTSYYKMSSAPIPTMSEADGKIRLMVGPVSVPERMDRPQLVVQSSGNEVQIYEYQRWAGSLKGDIARVVSASLARDLGTPNVWSFSDSTSTNFDYQILLDVQNIESSLDSGVVVDVLWTIKPASDKNKALVKNANPNSDTAPKSQTIMGRSLVSEATSGPGLDALVAAQSKAFARVGGEITQLMRR